MPRKKKGLALQQRHNLGVETSREADGSFASMESDEFGLIDDLLATVEVGRPFCMTGPSQLMSK